MEAKTVKIFTHYYSTIFEGKRLRVLRRTEQSAEKIRRSFSNQKNRECLSNGGRYSRSVPKVEQRKVQDKAKQLRNELKDIRELYYNKGTYQKLPQESSKISSNRRRSFVKLQKEKNEANVNENKEDGDPYFMNLNYKPKQQINGNSRFSKASKSKNSFSNKMGQKQPQFILNTVSNHRDKSNRSSIGNRILQSQVSLEKQKQQIQSINLLQQSKNQTQKNSNKEQESKNIRSREEKEEPNFTNYAQKNQNRIGNYDSNNIEKIIKSNLRNKNEIDSYGLISNYQKNKINKERTRSRTKGSRPLNPLNFQTSQTMSLHLEQREPAYEYEMKKTFPLQAPSYSKSNISLHLSPPEEKPIDQKSGRKSQVLQTSSNAKSKNSYLSPHQVQKQKSRTNSNHQDVKVYSNHSELRSRMKAKSKISKKESSLNVSRNSKKSRKSYQKNKDQQIEKDLQFEPNKEMVSAFKDYGSNLSKSIDKINLQSQNIESKKQIVNSSSRNQESWRDTIQSLSQDENDQKKEKKSFRNSYSSSNKNTNNLEISEEIYEENIQGSEQRKEGDQADQVQEYSKEQQEQDQGQVIRSSNTSNNFLRYQSKNSAKISNYSLFNSNKKLGDLNNTLLAEGSLQSVIDRILKHQKRIIFLKQYREEIEQDDYEVSDDMKILQFLLQKKEMFEYGNMVKCIERFKKYDFNLSNCEILPYQMDKYQSNPQIAEIKNRFNKHLTFMFRKLGQTYNKLKESKIKSEFIKRETPTDNFTHQIIRILSHEYDLDIDRLFEIVDDSLQAQYEENQGEVEDLKGKIYKTMELVLILSQFSGRKVRGLVETFQIENFGKYFEQNENLVIEAIQHFENIRNKQKT